MKKPQEKRGERERVPGELLKLIHGLPPLSLKNDTSIDLKQLCEQELLFWWWVAAAPAPASESNAKSATAAGHQEDQRRTTEDKRMREGKQHEHAKRRKEGQAVTGQRQKDNRTT